MICDDFPAAQGAQSVNENSVAGLQLGRERIVGDPELEKAKDDSAYRQENSKKQYCQPSGNTQDIHGKNLFDIINHAE